ncbi:MAG: single-stranded-DNA-specific exonuclease RecJ [Alphaproteobacteria bacterium]|nr:single-stranded-DNA-specific exonuclease RecJ [Alphaproteobacteria bacterium]
MACDEYLTPSLNGFIWHLLSCSEQAAEVLAERFSLPIATARILLENGISLETAQAFLFPKLKEQLPHPFSLKDMEKAAKRMAKAVINGEPIGIMGDYDVDGATSTSALKLYLEKCGIQVLTFIPEREDGYGPNAKKMQEYKNAGCSVVATLDCGTTAFEPVQFGTDLGLDVIILDHHNAESTLPNAYAVVNPKRLDEAVDHPCHHLAAVGVVFLFIVALNKILREQGFWKNKTEPNLIQFLDLVAFGTICDVVKLTGVNRLFVKTGLVQMATGQNMGLSALARLVNLEEKPNAFHLGYLFGPRVNACGRVGTSALGAKLLFCQDPYEADILAHEMETFNSLRKEIENDVLAQAIQQVENRTKDTPFIVVKGDNWHCGVIGIVAGRLKERYNLPVFALTQEKDELKGSARSVIGVDVGDLIMQALAQGILSHGGGHPMAAGFSLQPGKLDEFVAFLHKHIKEEQVRSAVPSLDIFGVFNLSGINLEFAKSLQLLEPFGEGNKEPLFVIQHVRIPYCNLLKNGHISCTLTNEAGLTMRAVAFHAADTEMGRQILASHGNHFFDVAVTVHATIWRGTEQVQIHIVDMRSAV